MTHATRFVAAVAVLTAPASPNVARSVAAAPLPVQGLIDRGRLQPLPMK
jgi:hypothetical protein